jgi:hypothetical protein
MTARVGAFAAKHAAVVVAARWPGLEDRGLLLTRASKRTVLIERAS